MRILFPTFLTIIMLSGYDLGAQAKKFLFPRISTYGKTLIDFIPKGWEIKDSAYGDFNKDSLQDFVVVIETHHPVAIDDTTCFSTQPFFPKMLLLFFRNADNSLRLSVSATKLFGNCNWGVQGQDPFQKLVIRKNTFGIVFLTGGTTRNYLTYYFRYQNDNWLLIGAESCQYWAGHTDGADGFYNQKINFLTSFIETYQEDQSHKRYNYKKMRLEKKALIKVNKFDDDTEIPFGEGM